jgi:hypothetical protein
MVAGGAIMSVSNEREVRGMKESIEVKDIIKKINSHVSFLKRSGPGALGVESSSKKIISCLFNTLFLMLDITYDEAIELVGIDDLFLFM